MNPHLLSLINNPKQVRGVSANIITGACGGYFFNSLFDGHPEILPINIHAVTQEPENYFYYYINRFPEKYRDVDFYTKCIDAWNIPGTYATHFKHPENAHIMRQAMRDGFVNLGDEFSYYHLYYLVYIGVAAACNYPLGTSTPIIFQHRHIFYPHLYKEGYAHLDNSFYINYFRLIRHPEMSLDRIFSNTCADIAKLPPKVSFNYAYPFYLYYQDDLYKYFPKNKLFSIKFEDLHLKSEEVLKACCQSLGIAYLPEVLLKSTVMGEEFVFSDPNHSQWDDSSEEKRKNEAPIVGFSKERGKNYSPKFLSMFQKQLISYFFEKFYLRYGYKEKAEIKYKIADCFFPIWFLFVLIPTYRELRIIFSFYMYYLIPNKEMWRPTVGDWESFFSRTSLSLLHKGKMNKLKERMKNFCHIQKAMSLEALSYILPTIDRKPFFNFMALEKSKWEHLWIERFAPILFWIFFVPIFNLMYMKIKTACFLIRYRFTSDKNLSPLINETYDCRDTAEELENQLNPLPKNPSYSLAEEG